MNSQRIREGLMRGLFLTCACLSVAAVLLICLFIFANGVPAMVQIGLPEFLGGKVWRPLQGLYGILPMIVGSLYVTAGAVLLGVPTGILTAVFLVKYCPGRVYKLLKPLINLLAGIPSIVYGFFGLMVIVPLVQQLSGTSGKGILTTSLLLGIMILPTVINTAEAALTAVPESYYEGSLALGATKERSIFRAVFPAAGSGILSGAILAVGRAVGETMAVVIVAGNQSVMPGSVLSGVRTLTANIVLEMGYAAGLHRGALIATAVVLFVFVLLINLCFMAVKRRGAQ